MSDWHISRDGTAEGPISEEEVLRRVAAGTLRAQDHCWREGMEDWQTISKAFPGTGREARVASQGPAAVAPGPEPLFLFIPVWRLILMSILTSGIYEAYWIYKNWKFVKMRDGLEI